MEQSPFPKSSVNFFKHIAVFAELNIIERWERMAATADEHFLSLGIQYYAAARLAVLAELSPVFGNLYHHAIEAFLKAQLSQKFHSKSLRSGAVEPDMNCLHCGMLSRRSSATPVLNNSTTQSPASDSLRNSVTLMR
jgi:hypothetical protein